MSKKQNLSVREQQLISEARRMLAETIEKTPDTNSLQLNEGWFSNFADWATGGNYSAAAKEIESGGKGKWSSGAAIMIRQTVDLGPIVYNELKAAVNEGLKTTNEALGEITEEKTKNFFEKAIKDSASRIAAAQEKEMLRIQKAVVKRVEAANNQGDEGADNKLSENAVKGYVNLIVNAAMLGALKMNLK
jgi:hypothetical protein